MTRLFASTSLLIASAVLYAAGCIAQSTTEGTTVSPTGLSVFVEETMASGPTLPPDDPTDDGGTHIASGPTLPPDDPTDDGGTRVV